MDIWSLRYSDRKRKVNVQMNWSILKQRGQLNSVRKNGRSRWISYSEHHISVCSSFFGVRLNIILKQTDKFENGQKLCQRPSVCLLATSCYTNWCRRKKPSYSDVAWSRWLFVNGTTGPCCMKAAYGCRNWRVVIVGDSGVPPCKNKSLMFHLLESLEFISKRFRFRHVKAKSSPPPKKKPKRNQKKSWKCSCQFES